MSGGLYFGNGVNLGRASTVIPHVGNDSAWLTKLSNTMLKLLAHSEQLNLDFLRRQLRQRMMLTINSMFYGILSRAWTAGCVQNEKRVSRRGPRSREGNEWLVSSQAARGQKQARVEH
jgi:hypothetical protein